MPRQRSPKSASESTAIRVYEAKLWLTPYKGRSYDRAGGSDGLLVQPIANAY